MWCKLHAGWKSNEAYGSNREKLTFALKECCLLLLCAQLLIAATRAHVGLFTYVAHSFKDHLSSIKLVKIADKRFTDLN